MTDMSVIKKNKIASLHEWADKNEISICKLKKVIEMVELGSRGERKPSDPFQFPDYYYADSQAKAWHDPTHYQWVSRLREAYPKIKEEALSVFDSNLMAEHPQNNDLANDGTWKTFFFYKNGQRFNDNMARCPFTTDVITNISGTSQAGRVYFSAMTPGTHVKPHCGPHNFKLRCHLGLVTSPKATIRVGDEVRYWEDGKCIVFDDSFEHEVWNESDLTRIVLIVDVWNPSLNEDEIKALLYLGIPTA